VLEISTAAPTFLKNGGFFAAPNFVFWEYEYEYFWRQAKISEG